MMVKTANEIRFSLSEGLSKAVQYGQYERVKQLLRKAPTSFLVRTERSLLLTALKIDNDKSRDKIFKYLVQRGASVRYIDKSTGMDVLSWAAHLGRADQIKTIMQFTELDMDILGKDKDFLTPLHHAVISGNIKAVEPIVEACSQYRLNIDICDKNGLTPYIHARKLGYHDIAELLVNVGKASTFMSDAKSFKSAEEWAVEGVLERMRNARTQMHRQKMSSKIGGQLARPVQSKKLPTIIVTTSNKKSYVVDLDKSKNFMGHSLKEFDDKRAHGLRPWEHVPDAEAILNTSQRTPYPSVSESLTLQDVQTKQPSSELPKLELENTNNNDKNKKFRRADFNYLMYILSEQSTNAFRKPVPPPEIPTSTVSSPDSNVQENILSLAILFGKEGKSGRSSSRRTTSRAIRLDRAPSRATKLDRAPSRVSSRKVGTKTLSKKKGKKDKTTFLPPIESKV